MFERKSINRRRKAAITRREKRQRLRRRCLRAETLESRQLLAGEITPTVIQVGAEATVLLEVDQSHQGDIHMRTDPVNGQVQYGVDGATWESISDDFSGMDSVEFNWVYSTAGGLLTDFGFGNFNPLKIDEFLLPGVDVSISAPRIIVLPGVTVSTATPIGASGDLTFKSPLFSASVGSSLVTDSVTDTDVAGDLTIRAHAGPSAIQSFFTGTLPLTPKITTSEATVSLSGTTVRAGDVIIDADADSSDLYDDQDEENENKFGPQVIESTSDLS